MLFTVKCVHSIGDISAIVMLAGFCHVRLLCIKLWSNPHNCTVRYMVIWCINHILVYGLKSALLTQVKMILLLDRLKWVMWCERTGASVGSRGLISRNHMSYIPVEHLFSRLQSLQRSLAEALLATPQSQLRTKGDWAFSVRALTVWKNLPEEGSLLRAWLSFKCLLRTYFYK